MSTEARDGQVTLEPVTGVSERAGFVATLTVGDTSAMLTETALAAILGHGQAILDAHRTRLTPRVLAPTGTITSAATGVRR